MLNRNTASPAPILHEVDGDERRGAAAAPACRIATQPGVIDRARGAGTGHGRHAVVLAGRGARDHGAGLEDARHDRSVDLRDGGRFVLAQVEGLGAARHGYARDGDVILDGDGFTGQQAWAVCNARSLDVCLSRTS